jgi:hypothetical protein
MRAVAAPHFTGGEPKRWWRRIERMVVRQHRDTVDAQLRELRGVTVLAAGALPSGIVQVIGSGWRITLGGVTAGAAAALVSGVAGSAGETRVASAGRYGRFWWVSVLCEGSEPRAVLGSHVRMDRIGPGSYGAEEDGPDRPGERLLGDRLLGVDSALCQ